MIQSRSRKLIDASEYKSLTDKSQEQNKSSAGIQSGIAGLWGRVKLAFAGKRNAQIARKLGIKAQSVQNYETGKSNPSLDTLIKASAETGRSIHWIVTGEGFEYVVNRRADSDECRFAEMASKYKRLSASDKRTMNSLLIMFEKELETRITNPSLDDDEKPPATWVADLDTTMNSETKTTKKKKSA